VGKKLLRVLVADDQDDMRNCIVKILSEEFEVIGAVSDGYELINAAIFGQPDAIVSDIRMPRLNGTDAMRGLQAGGINIPFIFLSSDKNSVEQFNENSMKCIRKTELFSQLRNSVRLAALEYQAL
jgi:CheY-like chemotaxis protein